MSQEQDFQRLIQTLKNGTPEGQLFLDRQIKPMVLWIFRSQGLGYQEEDLWQEILIKIWSKIETCHASSTQLLKGWIRSVAYNHCRNFRRSEKVESVPLDGDPRAEETPAPNNAAASWESEAFIKTATSVLNQLEKQVIEHRYMDELSIEEIARELDKPKNTIFSALYRAKKKMRDHLKKLHEK